MELKLLYIGVYSRASQSLRPQTKAVQSIILSDLRLSFGVTLPLVIAR